MIRPASLGRIALLLSAAALAALALLVVGSSPAQAQRTPPGTPQDVQLTAGDGKLTLTWNAPASWGALAAKGYQIDVAAGRWYGSADPPETTSSDWEVLADPGPTATSYTFSGRIFGNSVIHSYRHTVTNGTTYHLRIRAVSAPSGDPTDEVPGVWVVASGAPVAAGFSVEPASLTVPVGSRACYLVSPNTLPTAAVTVTADTSALTGTVGSNTVTYAETVSVDTSDWTWGAASRAQNRLVGRAFCVKGVTATTSPVTITHTASSADADYNGVAVPSVTLTVSAADATPAVRFLHSALRVVEGDSNLASHYPVDQLSLQRVVVRLDIAPAPTSDGHIVWHTPHPDCNGVTECAYPASTSSTYNVDYAAQWLLARRVFYRAGSNDMQFEFLIRSDDVPERDETVTIYLQDQLFQFNAGFEPNSAVCVGACGSPTLAQQSLVVTIIDDDAGQPVCATCAREGELGRLPAPSLPPANQAPTVSRALPDATIASESGTRRVSLAGVFADDDGDDLSVLAESSNPSVAAVSVAADHSSLTLTAGARGTATITVSAEDGNGGTVSDAFRVTVKSAPSVASRRADVGGLEVGATRDVSLAGVFSDPDGDALTITAGSGDDAVASVELASDGSALTLTGVSEGTALILVFVEDADGNAALTDFRVSVVAAPEPAQPEPQQAESTLTGAAARYDANADGKIGIPEYIRALRDHAQGRLTDAEWNEVLSAYLASAYG